MLEIIIYNFLLNIYKKQLYVAYNRDLRGQLLYALNILLLIFSITNYFIKYIFFNHSLCYNIFILKSI